MIWTYDPIAGRVDTGEGSVTVRRHGIGFLIAAAPELLAALEGLTRLDRTPDRNAMPAIIAARAAIAKAKGEPHDR